MVPFGSPLEAFLKPPLFFFQCTLQGIEAVVPLVQSILIELTETQPVQSINCGTLCPTFHKTHAKL